MSSTTQHGFAIIIAIPGQVLPSTLAVLADSLDEVVESLPQLGLPGEVKGVLPLALLESLCRDIHNLAQENNVTLKGGV